MLATLLSYVLLYKYPAIFVITFLGAIALPLPSGSVVMAAAAFATQGYMNIFLVLMVGVAGNMAGDSSGYWLVRRYGIKVLHKIHLGRFFHQDRLTAARKQLERHPILAIFFSRFFTAIAPAINVVSGLTKLSYKKYLLFEGLGEFTEVSFFVILGYIFGNNWQYINQFSGQLWILIVAGMLVSLMFWSILLKKS